MERYIEFGGEGGIDPSLSSKVEEVFHADNLVQLIIHAHVLVEKGLTAKILEREPTTRMKGWDIGRKAKVYVNLFQPPQYQREILNGLTRLRHAFAHDFQEEEIVSTFLPWETVLPEWATRGQPRPDPRVQVRTMLVNLLFDLEVLKSIKMTPEAVTKLVTTERNRAINEETASHKDSTT